MWEMEKVGLVAEGGGRLGSGGLGKVGGDGR